ncbi:hypothetical protein F4813DRAFT_344966 [Daldinia decipiens]|uniref:uncharacterized protein n=1 Tax=Daldinia decipiens TaxID=326647 RepID=UPI0020C3581C|nr:uncharacterized protein F4813DRAFT_344966 [Daldinia decipiens]KAI1661594.1 hypothetical protein F4813DRAFT_344966 [Daldinia decipiens]
MLAAPGPGNPFRQPCPHCQQSFTLRSLHEHLETSHLGVKCYFPGSSLVLAVEDDCAMIQELSLCNLNNGGGYRNGEFWCHWPNCNAINSSHSYKNDSNLKRHLRMKQKKIYLYNLNVVQSAGAPAVPTPAAAQVPSPVATAVPVSIPAQAPVPAPVSVPVPVPAPAAMPVPNSESGPPAYPLLDQAVIDELVLQVHLAMARREAKYECFRAMLMPQDPAEALTPDQRTKFRIDIKAVNDAVDDALRMLWLVVGTGPDGPDGHLQKLWISYTSQMKSVQLIMKFWINHFVMFKDQMKEWNKYLPEHTELQSIVDKILDEVKKIPCHPVHQPVKIEESGVKIEEFDIS